MNIECPKCGRDHEIEGDILPDHTCDDVEFECYNEDCFHVFTIGWYATIEVRQDRLSKQAQP